MKEVDILLICLAIVLFLVILFIIIIGIMYANQEKLITNKKNKETIKPHYKNKDNDEDNSTETYVRVRFNKAKDDLIYVAPKNILLKKGDKMKVLTDEGNIRTCMVIKGNYTREKYKKYKYQKLNIVY